MLGDTRARGSPVSPLPAVYGSSESAPKGARANVVAVLFAAAPAALGLFALFHFGSVAGLVAGAGAGLIAGIAPQVAKQWERAVVLRLGRYRGLRGPGLFWLMPFVDTISAWVDQRVITTAFAAEETLTSDTVPVNVDAVLFWMVHDPEKAALEVQNYSQAVSWAAQTGLRDIIGRTSLSDLLRGREHIESELQDLIDQRCLPWGIAVQSVEMRDVVIPTTLQDAMSREAQAAREKAARIILGQAEVEIASLFDQASRSYEKNPTALHLRAMNILYEGLKEKGALMVVPSTAVESMGLGGLLGAAALEQQMLSGIRSPASSSPERTGGEEPRRAV
jgi:regulator of protease activity HflC (stomatin/prohibitin superfamily)